ncbi:hypothetical protein Syun_028927 [Stephania yunnanensis]|uniref:Post-GPI attachment to proteins factor 3 n=1 Tax=Stephania yunnanensis TaxID=152371 RepID=A0AAP0HFK8_9MAGN
MLLEIYDFPPYKGFVDAHALWHAATIPLTYLRWNFIKDEAEFRTSVLVKKAKQAKRVPMCPQMQYITDEDIPEKNYMSWSSMLQPTAKAERPLDSRLCSKCSI